MRKNQSSEEELAGGRLVGGSLFSLEGPEERLAGDYSPLVAAEHLYRIVCGSLVIFRIGRVKDCCFFLQKGGVSQISLAGSSPDV